MKKLSKKRIKRVVQNSALSSVRDGEMLEKRTRSYILELALQN